MTASILRRSATVLSAVAIATLLGTPAFAGGQSGSATDKSGSSTNASGTFQGKGSSTPDQDGTGTDRGADNNDKTGPGTDGNNGCGNEPRAAAPRDGGRPTDDDNNGWCGAKPKPTPKPTPSARSAKPTPAVKPTKAAQATPAAQPTPTAQPAKKFAVGSATRHGSVAVAVAVAGVKLTRPIAPASVAGVRLTAARPAPSVLDQAALPYTGSSAQTLMILGVVLLAGGLVVTEMGRPAGATG